MVKSITDNSHVAAQYEKWVYPAPIMDLSTPEVRNTKRDGGDPDILFHTYWPNRPCLLAGCLAQLKTLHVSV